MRKFLFIIFIWIKSLFKCITRQNKLHMHKKIISKSFVVAVFFIGIIIYSCKKKEKVDNNIDAAADHIVAETQSNDIVNIGEQASAGSMTTYRLPNQQENIYTTCATITLDTLVKTDADTLIVDFGTSCTGTDGRTRSGILQYISTAGFHYRDSGNVIVVSSNNYVVDGNKININSKTIKNLGHITNGNLTWSVSANMSIVKTNGGTMQWASNKTKVLLAGEQLHNLPIDWAHAEIALYGSASGTSANGESFTANVTQANWLVRNFNCTGYRKCFVAGELDFTPAGKATRYVNFGTGNCDDLATITIDGTVNSVTLP